MDTNSNSKNDTGILLIGHGSRLPYNKEVVQAIAQKYSQTKPEYNIEVGFMELAEPNIPTAFNKLKESGVKRVIVTPVFLAHGLHTKRDIPNILGLEPAEEVAQYTKGHGHHHHHHGHGHEEDGHKHEEEHGHHHGHGHHHHHGEEEKVEFDGEIIYTEPIGADDAIVEIIANRVNPHLE
jgi:sirohydrochlorin cobaltochelatase